MKIIKNFNEVDPLLDLEFKKEFHCYKKDLYVKTFFEKIFGVTLIQAYVYSGIRLSPTPTKAELRWDCSEIVLFLASGRIVEMSNSEWASFKTYEGKQQ